MDGHISNLSHYQDLRVFLLIVISSVQDFRNAENLRM